MKKILVADDSTTIQRVFEKSFPPSEFQLFFANNGREALEKARESRPDLIIADINMPEKGGVEVCQEVKRDPELRDIPVLLLVGVLDDFDEREVEKIGAVGHLIKPFESTTVLERVRQILSSPPTEEEEVIELKEVVEEAAPKEEKEFILDLSLKDLEEPKEELELESLLREEGPAEELKGEKIEAILDESAMELAKIEPPSEEKEEVPPEEEVRAQEEFMRGFEGEFAPEEGRPSGELEGAIRRLFQVMAEEFSSLLSKELKKTIEESVKVAIREELKK